MTTKSKTIKRTAKPKTAAPAPLKRTRAKADQAGGIDLLRIADKVGLQQYAAEGFRDRQTQATELLFKCLEEAEGGGVSPADQPLGLIIKKAQIIRELGRRGPDDTFAGLDAIVEGAAGEDRELNRLSRAIDAKYKEYGAKDDEHWPDGEAPEDMEVLRKAFDERQVQLKVSIFRHYGENEMADLLLNDPAAYTERVKRGRAIFDKNHIPALAKKYAWKAKDEKAE